MVMLGALLEIAGELPDANIDAALRAIGQESSLDGVWTGAHSRGDGNSTRVAAWRCEWGRII